MAKRPAEDHRERKAEGPQVGVVGIGSAPSFSTLHPGADPAGRESSITVGDRLTARQVAGISAAMCSGRNLLVGHSNPPSADPG